tara:strand:- start:268 stop:522 length:255 start_codon:yes stop_codon:yes gene_type:complete
MSDHLDSDGWFDKPENVSKMLKVFYVICGLLVIADFIVHRHIYHSWENVPGFYAIYGFVGCSLLVFIAKWMRTFLMREEDYYDE